MSRTTACLGIAVLTIAAITALSIPTYANSPEPVILVLLGGILLYTIGIVAEDSINRRKGRNSFHRRQPSASHVEGWKTRKTRESEQRLRHIADLRATMSLDDQRTRH